MLCNHAWTISCTLSVYLRAFQQCINAMSAWIAVAQTKALGPERSPRGWRMELTHKRHDSRRCHQCCQRQMWGGKKKKKKAPFRVQRFKLLVEHGPAGIKCIAAFTSSQQTSPSKLGQRSTWMLRNQDDIREDCADVLETWFWNAGGRQPQFISMYWRCNKYFVCGVNYSFYGSVVYRLFEK